MKFDDVYDGMAHTVRKGFSTRKVFGEPIKVNERVTIIPVAKVMMGGGGGGGEESVEDEEKKDGLEIGKKGVGGGFGFRGGVKPVGYIKIKGSCVKFKRIHDWEHVLKMMLPPVCLCLLIVKHKMMQAPPHHMSPWDHKMMMKRKMMMMHGMHPHHMDHGPMHECKHHQRGGGWDKKAMEHHQHMHQAHMHHHPGCKKEMMKGQAC